MKVFPSSRAFLLIFALAGVPGLIFANDRIPRPKIQIQGAMLKIDGKLVLLGDKVEAWLVSVPGKARCSHEKNSLKFCAWDDLGLEIGTDLEDTTRVKFANINLAFDRDAAP